MNAAGIAQAVRSGQTSAREQCEAALARIAARNPALNAIVTQRPEASRAEADTVDARVAAGESLPLAGAPYTLKDNLWAAGWRATQGSKLFADHVAPRDSACVERFRAAGAVPNPFGFPEPNLGISVIGVMARNIADTELALSALTAYEPLDPWSAPAPPAAVEPRPAALRIAWSRDLGCGFPVDADVLAALESLVAVLAREGCMIEEASPDWPAGTAEYPLLAVQQAGLAALFGDALAARRADLDPDIAAQIELGLGHSGAAIAQRMLQRELITQRLAQFFARFDLLLTPTAPVTAWPLGQLGPAEIGGKPAGPRGHAAFTPLFNYCGVPACSVPAGLVRGLPVGLQIAGPRWSDARVLAFARFVEGFVPTLEAP